MTQKRRWTPEERRALLDGIGVYGHAWLGRHTDGRTRKAIAEKIGREFGPGGRVTRGTYSLAELETVTGYTRRQLQRAQTALGQRWTRTSRTGTHLITDDQLTALAEWLRTDYWAGKLRLYGCVECGTDQHPHEAAGLCGRCYGRHRRLAIRLGLRFSVTSMRAMVDGLLGVPDEDPTFPSDSEDGVFLSRVAKGLYAGRTPVEVDLRRLASYRKVLK